MFDLVKSSSATTYPWVITKEIYLVQDTRPLYHYPEFKLTTTMYDNWEPQFKPVNQQNLETKNQLSLDDPKANETAVGVLRMLMNTIIEEDDGSSLVESASYDTHSTHTLHTKSGGDNKDDDDDDGTGIDKKKDDSHDDDNRGVVVVVGDDDRSHKTASDSKSIGSKSKDILKDDNSINSRHSNNNNNNDNDNDNNSGTIHNNDNGHNNENGHDVDDDMNHDDDDDENDYSEDH